MKYACFLFSVLLFQRKKKLFFLFELVAQKIISLVIYFQIFNNSTAKENKIFKDHTYFAFMV